MTGWLVLAALAALVVYVASARIWPLRSCGRCGGEGRLRSPGRSAWRVCPRCGGSGVVRRWGAGRER